MGVGLGFKTRCIGFGEAVLGVLVSYKPLATFFDSTRLFEPLGVKDFETDKPGSARIFAKSKLQRKST